MQFRFGDVVKVKGGSDSAKFVEFHQGTVQAVFAEPSIDSYLYAVVFESGGVKYEELVLEHNLEKVV